MGTSIDYSAVSLDTIHHQLTGGAGSAPLRDASRGWQSVAATLHELQDRVDQAVRGIGAAQQGAAADAATHATMALTPWIGESVTAASGIAARVSEQAGFFAHLRDSMPVPHALPEVSFTQDPGTWMTDHSVEWLPGINTEHERALVAAQQDEQRARELMSDYQGATNENLTVRRLFAAAPAVVAEVTDPVPSGVGVGDGNGGGSAHPSSGHSSPAHSSPAHLGLEHSGLGHPAAAHPGSATGGHGAGAAPAATASQLASRVHQGPTTPQLASGYPSPAEAPVPGGSVQPAPFGPSPILTGSGAAGGERLRGGSRSSGGRGVSRGGGFGPRPTAASSTGDSRLGGSRLSDSGLGGSATHGYVEEAGAGRAARSGTAWAQAPLGATGGSGRDGSTEHRRPSYLIEQDTSAIIGELPRVAPPVIGTDEDYR